MAPPREAVAIAELVCYVPLTFISLYVAFRHVFAKQFGWIFLNIFCALRIAGAGLEIASARNSKVLVNAKWAAIVGAIGLSPLLLAGFGMFKTMNDIISPKSILSRAILLLHIICIVPLILSIAGGTQISSSNQSNSETGATLLKTGGIIFLVLYIIHILLVFLTMLDLNDIPQAQKHLFVATLLAIPALGVRVLYSLMVYFAAGDEVFSFTDGNVFVKLGMAIIMEMLIAITYAAAGLKSALGTKTEPRGSVEEGFPWGGEQSVPLRNISPGSDHSSTGKAVKFASDSSHAES